MSELINTRTSNASFRSNLLTNASALTLLGYVCLAPALASPDEDRPTVWIELGGQLERADTPQAVFAPTFVGQAIPQVASPIINAQRPSRYSIGEEGKMTLEPSGSDWVLSAAVRYGRSNAARHQHYQTTHPFSQTLRGQQVVEGGRPLNQFGDGQASSHESHLVLDFLAGKDVGLGLFGAGGSSVVSAGVRFAQFTSNSHVSLHARPIYHSGPVIAGSGYRFIAAYFQNNTAVLESKRNTHAIGPAVAWDASMRVAGNNSSAIAFDWGVNAAVLFGRQKAHVHHQTTDAYLYVYPAGRYPSQLSGYVNAPPDRNRSRAVTIPNVGGFAAVSFRYLDAKVKFGYRADFFFNALDSGIDTRNSQNVGFYGPFATISIGLGG